MRFIIIIAYETNSEAPNSAFELTISTALKCVLTCVEFCFYFSRGFFRVACYLLIFVLLEQECFVSVVWGKITQFFFPRNIQVADNKLYQLRMKKKKTENDFILIYLPKRNQINLKLHQMFFGMYSNYESSIYKYD